MGTLNILIVEDDPVIAASIGELVCHEGHKVCAVVSRGNEVVQQVLQYSPDVVLMDLHLSDGPSGTQVTRELVETFNVPVIVISGTDQPDELRAIAASGALGFIKKPIAPEELNVVLRIATNHNTAMRELRLSEMMHRSIFDDAAVGIYMCHKDGHYLTCNNAFARMLGYSGPAELLRLVLSADEQVYVQSGRRLELLKELEAGKEVRFAQSQVYGRDGNIIWISEHISPTMSDEHALMHYKGVAMDITRSKRAENERRVAYILMQTTMDAIADFIAVTDLDGNIIFTNEAFERELGDIVGNNRALVFEHGESCPFARFIEELGAPVEPGYQLRGYCTLQGYHQWLSVGITRYESAGEILGAVFVMHAVPDTSSELAVIQSPS